MQRRKAVIGSKPHQTITKWAYRISARCTRLSEVNKAKIVKFCSGRHTKRRMSIHMIGDSWSKPHLTELINISHGAYMSSLEPFGSLQLWWETYYPISVKVSKLFQESREPSQSQIQSHECIHKSKPRMHAY